MKPRVAVIGVGNFGALHARTLASLPDADLVALVDGDLRRAQALAQELGIPHVFATLGELIQKGVADAVIIATRADTHLPLAREAIAAGLPVLVEKPFANSAGEIRQFAAAVGQPATAVMVNHLCLFHALIAPLVKRLDESGFRALHFVRHRPERVGQRFPDDHPIQLIMVHDLYVAARIFGGEQPVSFQAMEGRNAAGRVDLSWAALRWADGRVATFHSHTTLPDGAPADGWDYLEVFGDGFHSRVTTNPAPWVWSDTRTNWPVTLEISDVLGVPTGMLSGALQAFLSAVQGHPVPAGCRIEDALHVQEWIEKLLQTAGNPS